ncbi:hypothetical protein E4U47_006335 [Claviceps purpurea]|nr:hypothetical protein E4U36_008098 [Claviceps purpurea]KAG6247896.1 hypothetical protein E4U23_003432 [Claviceps purpurea]KAG6278029.1 hypothetical protein E4U47_006335 [Claviceps purpurea]
MVGGWAESLTRHERGNGLTSITTSPTVNSEKSNSRQQQQQQQQQQKPHGRANIQVVLRTGIRLDVRQNLVQPCGTAQPAGSWTDVCVAAEPAAPLRDKGHIHARGYTTDVSQIHRLLARPMAKLKHATFMF